MTRHSKLLSNSAINLFGQLVPMLVALVAIPRLIHGLGIDRFGVLTLAWLVVGYFSLFDLGLGRALTQLVATRLMREEQGLRGTIGRALLVMLGMGIVGMVICAALTPTMVRSAFKIPASLIGETSTAFYLLAASIPVVIVTAGLIGILTAYGRFGLINWIRIPLGVSNYLLPLGVLIYTNDLAVLVGTLVAARALAMLAYWLACRRCLVSLPAGSRTGAADIKSLFGFGGWMTVTNVVGPVMIYMDRFVIGAIVSVAAVAYYATPFEMVTKLLIVPSAIVTVLFPALTMALRESDRSHLLTLLQDSWRYVALALFPAVLVIVAFGHEGMQAWLGQNFADNSTIVLQILAAGVFFNAFAQIPFTLVQSSGRPDLTAKLHLVELVVYLPCLVLALRAFGIAGAAAVWTLRVIADGAMLLAVTRKLLPETLPVLKSLVLFLLVSGGGLLLAAAPGALPYRLGMFTVIGLAFVFAIFRFDLAPAPVRTQIFKLLGRSELAGTA